MKYMNQSRVFGRARCKAMLPMNLQFFAEGDGGAGGEAGADGGNAGTEPAPGTEQEGEKKPSYDELLALLNAEKADKERIKNLKDVASREAADFKKKYREKMTAEEQAALEKKEADEAKDARIKELEEKMAVIDNTSFWGGKSIGMDEALAKSTAEAEATGDKEKFRENIAKHIKSIKDSAYQQALADRPEIAAGNGAADKNSAAKDMAVASAKRLGGVNEDIIKQYRR